VLSFVKMWSLNPFSDNFILNRWLNLHEWQSDDFIGPEPPPPSLNQQLNNDEEKKELSFTDKFFLLGSFGLIVFSKPWK